MYTPVRHAGSILWKRKPVHLTFFLTRKCNGHCPYCFYLESADRQAPAAPELSLEEIRKVSASIGNLLWLAFSGGEIFLRKDLVEISRVFYENNKPAIMLLPTNGLLPDLITDRTRQILEHCHKSVIVVKLSLDGVGEDHDSIRKTRGNFAKAMQTYRRIEGMLGDYPNLEVGINTVLNARNQETIGEVIDYVNRLGSAGVHTVSMVRGDLRDPGYKQVDPDKYLYAAQLLKKQLQDRTSNTYRFGGGRLKAAQDIVQRNMIHQTLIGRKRSIPCYAGKLNLVLTESGDVYPCEILPESLGNIRDHDYDMMKVASSERAAEVMHSIAENGSPCSTCTHECNYITNILFNPAMYPSLLREYIRL